MKFSPLNGYLLVKPINASTETASGLMINKEKDEVNSGIVVAIDNDHILTIKVGSTVYYHQVKDENITIEGNKYALVAYETLYGYDQEDTV